VSGIGKSGEVSTSAGWYICISLEMVAVIRLRRS
jgi:hypothetical protein